MSANKLGWGILGTAQIARKNWRAIQNTGNSTVVAVASRDLERCQKFIRECQAEAPMDATPQAFGSYEDLLACEAVEAVYIPLPTGLRREWVLRAAAAGKHIVCEKPCAVNLADLREMLEACRRHRVQFMDGVMFMHSRRLARVREVLDDGESVGSIRRVTSAFSFCAPAEFFGTNIRTHGALEPYGCLGGPGLVLPPLHALGPGLETAAGGHRTAPFTVRPGGNYGPCPNGILRRTPVRRRHFRRLLLLFSRRKPAMGQRQRHARVSAGGGFRAAVRGR